MVKALKKLREKSGVNQREFASRIGTSRSALRKMENGKASKSLSLNRIRDISENSKWLY